jgi:uncharacterized HhH-GPD family protein
MPAPKPDERLFYTDDDAANRLIATNPMALLIGFALDQQVPVQKAFSGPQVLLQRLGTLDPGRLAKVDEAALLAAAKGPPAIHRFPGAMAKRVRELATFVAREYDGDASRIWTDATDARDLKRRLGALPGFGEMKVASLLAVLARRLEVRPSGIDEVLPTHPTLGDVDSPAALADYQATKRAARAAKRASPES